MVALSPFLKVFKAGTGPELSTDPVLSSRLNNRLHNISYNLKNSKKPYKGSTALPASTE